MFSADEAYLTLGRWTDDIASSGLLAPSDYTGQHVYYQSLRERSRDVLTAYDYLWRWDTDWFWCSGAFGAQNPTRAQGLARASGGAATSTTRSSGSRTGSR